MVFINLSKKEMDWLITVVDKAMLSDNYYFTCGHCLEQTNLCKSKFCENIKRQLLIHRDNKIDVLS